jgi:hypothetical protein
MSSLHHRLEITDQRILAVSTVASNLIAQLNKLNELRERISKAQLPDKNSGGSTKEKERASRMEKAA